MSLAKPPLPLSSDSLAGAPFPVRAAKGLEHRHRAGGVRLAVRGSAVIAIAARDVGVPATTRIPRSQAQLGDLVSFISGGVADHNGIYAGNGMMYDAPRTGKTVGLHALWSADVVFARVTGRPERLGHRRPRRNKVGKDLQETFTVAALRTPRSPSTLVM